MNYPEELLLVTVYTNVDGAFCNLVQGWSGENQSIVGDDKNAVWRKQPLKKGQTLYYFTNEERNSLDGVVIAADYTLMVYTEYTTDARWVARALQVP